MALRAKEAVLRTFCLVVATEYLRGDIIRKGYVRKQTYE